MRYSIAAAALGLLAPPLVAQEQTVAVKDAPPAVIQTARARFPDARFVGVAKERDDDGKQVYEVTLKQAGRTIDVTTTPEGQLSLIEKEIPRSQLPASVAKLLDQHYPRATYRIVEEVTSVSGSSETISFYEVLLVDAKKQTLEVEVAPDGSKILKVEKKKPGEPND
jgi:putative PepSY-like beta-lactamase-inhibitor